MTPTVVCWKWEPFAGYRSKFEACHVNTFARMIRRNTKLPVEVVCITDDAEGITECDRTIPLWDEFATLRSPHDRRDGPQRNPSCYRRLRMFAADAGRWLGKRIVSIDLDVVITGDITPILRRSEPFVAWGDTNPTTYYNGSLIMFDAGSCSQIYEGFKANPAAAMSRATELRQFGSDQAWISACMGPGKPKLTVSDGVYSYRNHIRPRGGGLPTGAKICIFHGQFDPGDPEPQKHAWVREHYR